MKNKSIVLMILLLALLLFGIVYINRYKNNKEEEKIAACLQNYKKIYLTLDEKYEIDGNIEVESNNVITVVNGGIKAVGAGSITFKVDGCDMDVEVTNLYTIPSLNNSKPYLTCGQYTYEENVYIDEALKRFINEAGYQTRAGVVEAARFLTLRFKNKLSYFYENGRLGNDGEIRRITDGEGRYYHKGLYLSNEKINSISISNNGPQIWGCELYENFNETYKSNGLDCSGFVCWAMYNAGFDIGDIGAGITDDVIDLTDVGIKKDIKDTNFNDLKVGDLIGFDGHIAMIIGIKNNDVYIAQMYWVGDLQVLQCDFNELEKNDWEYVMLMDDYYKQDGNLTNYWN